MPYTDSNNMATLFAAGLYTFSKTAPRLELNAIGARFFLNVTAIAGAGAAVTIQITEIDPLTGNSGNVWQFPQVTSAGSWELTIYPNIQTAANQAINDCIQSNLRIDAIIGGTAPQVQMSLCAVPIW